MDKLQSYLCIGLEYYDKDTFKLVQGITPAIAKLIVTELEQCIDDLVKHNDLERLFKLVAHLSAQTDSITKEKL